MNDIIEIDSNGERGHVQAQDHNVVQTVDAPEGEGIKNKPTDKEKDRQVFFMPPDEVSKPTISKPHQCSFHKTLIRA